MNINNILYYLNNNHYLLFIFILHSYKLLSYTDTFEIHKVTGIIRNKKTLDRETQEKYDVKVQINDAKFQVYLIYVNMIHIRMNE